MEEIPQYWQNLDLKNIRYIDQNGIEQEEQWKDVFDYEGLYIVSDLGRVKALDRTKWSGKGYYNLPTHILKQTPTDKRGYVRVTFTKDGKTVGKYVHILVANLFIENPLKKRTVNHIFGDKKDNRKVSLEWMTYGENHKHSYKQLGRKHSMKGITGYDNKKSKEILCVTTGKKYGSLSEAGRELNIPFQNISKVCHGKRPSAHGLTFKYIETWVE